MTGKKQTTLCPFSSKREKSDEYEQQNSHPWLYHSSVFLCSIVEDPNEEFSDMRDKNDMRHLTANGVFKDLKAPIKKDQIEKTAQKFKLTKVRSF